LLDQELHGVVRAKERTKYNMFSSKGNGKEKILPGLARAMEWTKYYLI
jgi:hypothetical protein